MHEDLIGSDEELQDGLIHRLLIKHGYTSQAQGRPAPFSDPVGEFKNTSLFHEDDELIIADLERRIKLAKNTNSQETRLWKQRIREISERLQAFYKLATDEKLREVIKRTQELHEKLRYRSSQLIGILALLPEPGETNMINVVDNPSLSKEKVTCYKFNRPFDAILFLADGQVIEVRCPMFNRCLENCDELNR